MNRKQARSIVKASAFSGLAFVLPGLMLFGFFGGQWLDGKLGTRFLSVVGLLLGLAGGLLQTVRQARQINETFPDQPGRKPKPKP